MRLPQPRPAERGGDQLVEPLEHTVGAALQVSDTAIDSPHIRKVVTAHTIAAFIYNVGVFALTVNMLAGRS